MAPIQLSLWQQVNKTIIGVGYTAHALADTRALKHLSTDAKIKDQYGLCAAAGISLA